MCTYFSKSFDGMLSIISIEKKRNMGMGLQIYQRMYDYLTNWRQFIQYKNYLSQ